jgi:hypothetical protein
MNKFRKAAEGADFVINSLQRAPFKPAKMGSKFCAYMEQNNKGK